MVRKALSLRDLKAASDEDLESWHDQEAKYLNVSAPYYLDEIARRRQNLQTAAVLRYTRWIAIMTVVVTATTVINVGIAGWVILSR